MTLFFLVNVWCATPALAQVPPTSVVRSGDVLKLVVWREPTLSGEFVVSPDGTVTHPLYREIKVAGKSLRDVEAAFHELLGRYASNPQFAIDILVPVSVDGEVRRAGVFNVSPGVTLSQVVAVAGGATERAKSDQARLYRDGQLLLLDLTQPNVGLAATPVRSGDQLFIATRTSVFRDYIVPAATVTAAIGTLVNIFIR